MNAWRFITSKWQTSTVHTSGGDWFCPAYGIPDNVKEELQYYAGNLPWDETAKLQDPSKYHITSFYSPAGYSNPQLQQWLGQESGPRYLAETHSLDNFTPSGTGDTHPVVMRFHSPELAAHAEHMMDQAEQRGLSPARFEGGHKAHITLGHNPVPIQADVPHMQFMTEPLHELHSYYDSLKNG